MNSDVISLSPGGGDAALSPLPSSLCNPAQDPLGGFRVGPKSASCVSIKGDFFEKLLEDCIEVWQKLFPWEPRLFLLQMEHNKRLMLDVWTEKQHFRRHSDVPKNLSDLISYQLKRQGASPDWMIDEDCRTRFFKRFKACLYSKNPGLQKNPEPTLPTGGP